MGIRQTQYIGLTKAAEDYLSVFGKRIGTNPCPHCSRFTSTDYKKRQYSTTYGMFEEEIPLWEYELNNGDVVREEVQISPWSSGPMIFVKLVDSMGKDLFSWTYDPSLSEEVDFENGKYNV
jgi:hypothetical protein